MDIESMVRPDVWKAIQAHYEREDYTECIRDAIYLICDLLRELSGIEDKDGTKLVDSALLGSNPPILLNNYETTTEKDFQQGIAFSLKGIMQAIRNPMSHEKKEHPKEDAETIILYISYLLNQIDHSGGVTKIDNILDLLFDEDFTGTIEYADLLLKEVPKKKKYELAIKLYNDKKRIPNNGVNLFINELIDSLSKAERQNFCLTISRSLMKCKDDIDLRKYFQYFLEKTYESLDKLVQLRIENMIIKSIRVGKMIDTTNPNTMEIKRKSNPDGSLGTWACGNNKYFCNQDEFFETLINHIASGKDEEEYVFCYFASDLLNRIGKMTQSQIQFIKGRLKTGDKTIYNWLWESVEFIENKEIIEQFGTEYEICKKIIENESNKNRPVKGGI